MTPISARSVALQERLPYIAIAIPVAALFSIAVCNLLIGLATALILVARVPWRLPPIRWPLAIFLGMTLVSVALSESPADGWPQVRKLYLFLTLAIIGAAVRRVADVRRMMLAMITVGTLSALWSMAQFWTKYLRARELKQDFYQAYVADRITGFMSHWMTFAGEMMTVALILAALLLFAKYPRWMLWAGLSCGIVIALALLLGWTRSIWPATAAGGLYLVWHWRRKWILAAPVLAVVIILAAPGPMRTRIMSVYKPDSRLDTNQHRSVLLRTGVRMIQANPLFGVGPEHVERRFLEYVPSDVARPLPPHWWYGHLHNIYLQYAAERGLPALGALLWLIGKVLVDFGRALGRLATGAGDQRFVLHAATAIIVGVLVGGWWEHNLGDSEVLTLFLSMIGCGYVAVEHTAPEEQWHAGNAA